MDSGQLTQFQLKRHFPITHLPIVVLKMFLLIILPTKIYKVYPYCKNEVTQNEVTLVSLVTKSPKTSKSVDKEGREAWERKCNV